VALAALVCSAPSRAAIDAEEVLAGKGLYPSGLVYVLRAEDEVKKAARAAETRLKEYRRAVAWDKDATRSEADRKALAADLTKQRDALKQQMDQTLPQIRAQIQALTQQQMALRQQMTATGGYGARGAGLTSYAMVGQFNNLAEQIAMLQAQGNQMADTYTAMGNQINMLSRSAPAPAPDAAKGKEKGNEKPSTAQSDAAKKAYVDALAAVRKLVDETNATYATLAKDAQVKAALDSLNKKPTQPKRVLGPSKKFLDAVKALAQAEAKVASDTLIDEPGPAASPKRKSRGVHKKK
jgi:hypothetical protein